MLVQYPLFPILLIWYTRFCLFLYHKWLSDTCIYFDILNPASIILSQLIYNCKSRAFLPNHGSHAWNRSLSPVLLESIQILPSPCIFNICPSRRRVEIEAEVRLRATEQRDRGEEKLWLLVFGKSGDREEGKIYKDANGRRKMRSLVRIMITQIWWSQL